MSSYFVLTFQSTSHKSTNHQYMLSTYQKRFEKFEAQASALQKKSDKIGYFRLSLFLICFFGGIYLISKNTEFGLLFFGGFLVVFAVLVKWHDKIKAQRDYYQSLSLINQQEIKALQYDFSAFEGGEEFKEDEHPYIDDLDIFGDRSIYQFLNRTSTVSGNKTLADWLKAPSTKAEILQRQSGVDDLKKRLDWRQDYRAKGMQVEDTPKDIRAILQWLKEPFFILNQRFVEVLIFVLPVLMTIAIVLFSMGIVPLIAPLLLWFVNLGFIKYTHDSVTKTIDSTAKQSKLITVYSQLIEVIEGEKFESERLKQIQQQLQLNNQSASKVIGELSGYAANLNVRENVFAYLVLNTFFLWELIFCRKLELWKKQMQQNMEEWLQVMGEIEALSSFANTHFNHPDWTLPTIHDQHFQLQATEMGHFLIPPEQRINNTLHVPSKEKIILITGSNMAGKSTFLRTVGINIILAVAGAPVCAKSFETSVVTVNSSMRNKDSLQENESSFFAELKALKKIIDVVEAEQTPIFFLMDEILKGTNSNDRHQGSVALIRQLLQHKGVGIIATHDLDLCTMENRTDKKVENWCFEVEITEEGKMIFDYTFKRGVCQSMNATTLMKQMGIEVET
ncbi:MAG: MutS-related protein [Chitinophagales bacterium]